jgi:hypothetical protein
MCSFRIQKTQTKYCFLNTVLQNNIGKKITWFLVAATAMVITAAKDDFCRFQNHTQRGGYVPIPDAKNQGGIYGVVFRN